MNEAVTEDALAAERPLDIEPEHAVTAALLRRRLLLFTLIAFGAAILDQLSKLWVRAAIPMNGDVPALPGWVHLTHTLNHGAAWSMLSGQRWLLVGVTIVVIGVVVTLARDFAKRGTLPVVGLGLVLGGAIGNLIDRVLAGAVTDFIDLDTPLRWLETFPVFNVADSALTVGVTLLLIYTFLGGETKSQDETSEDEN
jgi:signal peptidase II